MPKNSAATSVNLPNAAIEKISLSWRTSPSTKNLRVVSTRKHATGLPPAVYRISVSVSLLPVRRIAFAARHGGMEEVLVFLNSIGMNYADFEEELRNQLMIRSFIRLRFRPFVNVRLEEAEKYYNEVYKTKLQKEGKEVPDFEESLEEIQSEMVESGVQERTKEWLDSLRRSATITIKE